MVRTAKRRGPAQELMNTSFLDYYICPEEFAPFTAAGNLGPKPAFFRFGNKITCFGRSAAPASPSANGHAADVLPLLDVRAGEVALPFDLDEVVENIRKERYISQDSTRSLSSQLIRKAYYFARPLLSVTLRKHLQRFHLRERKNIEFPSWPLDKTIDNLCGELMALAVKANGNERVPFVWFWPDEHQGCVLMTHDIEHEAGRAFCSELMNIDERFGIRSSFQVVPEERYEVSEAFLGEMRARGFEVNVHDLNHDGQLFENREQFFKRAKKINEYAKRWGAEGFRAGGMYRNAEWNDALEVAYDMSFPSAAHLEPQIGGTCSVMPYFLGNLVELPLTTTQDYTLFHILGQYSIDLWKDELDCIDASNGLASFIVHPDYVIEERPRRVYENLLRYLADYCQEKKIWQPLPREAAQWWRERSRMRVVRSGSSWKVEGAGSNRACLAYAHIEDGRLAYHVEHSHCSETLA